MATLVLILSQLPSIGAATRAARGPLGNTYDAGVLPRHKQEQLGRLARMAVGTGGGSPGRAATLSWLVPNGPDIDVDSEFRVSNATLATLDRDPQRVLLLLGPQKDAVPIVDSMDAMSFGASRERVRVMAKKPAARGSLRESCAESWCAAPHRTLAA